MQESRTIIGQNRFGPRNRFSNARAAPQSIGFVAMNNVTKPKYHGQDDWDAHALAIGKIVMAWNQYQEMLGEIFAGLFGRRDWRLALAAWHALDNDRAQRSMLDAIANIKFKPTDRACK